MVGQYWSYCDPYAASGDQAAYPWCECLPRWEETEGAGDECTDAKPAEFCRRLEDSPDGQCIEDDDEPYCPSLSVLAKCDLDDEHASSQSWCSTTYETCDEQGTDSADEGWSYCDPRTGYGELADCMCKESWKWDIYAPGWEVDKADSTMECSNLFASALRSGENSPHP